MWPMTIKERAQRPRRDPMEKEVKKSPKVVLNFDAQDDVYIVNATDFGSDLLAVRYSCDNTMLVVGGALGNIRTVQPNTHEVTGTYRHSEDGSLDDPITCIREHPSSSQGALKMLATSARGFIQGWDLTNGQLQFAVQEPHQSLGLGVSTENFITTGDDGVLYVYDTATTKAITKLSIGYHQRNLDGEQLDGYSTRSFAVAFNPKNPKEAISGGWDDCVHFWDIRQRHSIRTVGPAHICGSDALDFTPDGKQLYAALYLSDSVICAGGSDPNLFRVVNIQQKETIGLIKDMSRGVTSIHKAGSRLKFRARPKLNKGREPPTEKSGIPRVAFCAGQYLFEVEFY